MGFTLHRASGVLAVILLTFVSACTSKQHLSALPPSGLAYPGPLIAMKDQPVAPFTPRVEELNRQTPTFQISQGTLPQGLTFDSSNGTIQGVPSVTSGVFPLTVTVTTKGGSASGQLLIAINDLSFSYATLPAVREGDSIPNFSASVSAPPSTAFQPQYSLGNCIAIKDGVAQPAAPASNYINSVAIDPQTGKVTGTLKPVFYSQTTVSASLACTVSASVASNSSISSSAVFGFDVIARLPKCSYADATVNMGRQALDRSPIIDSTSGPILSYQLLQPSEYASIFNASTGKLYQNPLTAGTTGTKVVKVKAIGRGGDQECSPFNVIANPNVTYGANAEWIGFTNPTQYQRDHMGEAAYQNAYIVKLVPQNWPSGGFQNVSVSPALPAGVTLDRVNGVVQSSSFLTVPEASTSYVATLSSTGQSPIDVTFKLTFVRGPVISYNTPNRFDVKPFGVETIRNTSVMTLTNFAAYEYNTTNLASSFGVDIQLNGDLRVNTQVPRPLKSFHACGNFNEGQMPYETYPLGIKDCAKVDIEVVPFTISYPTAITLNWGHPIPANTLVPTVSNGPASQFTSNFPLSGLGTFDRTTGILASVPSTQLVSLAPGDYSYTVSAVKANGATAAPVTIQVTVKLLDADKPKITYKENGIDVTQANPWLVPMVGNETISPVPVAGSVAADSYNLSCATTVLRWLSFPGATGAISPTGIIDSTRTAQTNVPATNAICTAIPLRTIDGVTIQGPSYDFAVKPLGNPDLYIAGIYDSADNIVQGANMADANQNNYAIQLDVGKVTIGAEPKNIKVKIKNTGDGPASGIQLSLDDSNGSYIVPTTLSDIPGNNSVAYLNFQFSPKLVGMNRAVLSLRYLRGTTTVTRTINLKGMGMRLAVSMTKRSFGDIPSGSKPDWWQEVRNLGDTPLTFRATTSGLVGDGFEFRDINVNNSVVMFDGNAESHCVTRAAYVANPTSTNSIAANSGCFFAVKADGQPNGSPRAVTLNIYVGSQSALGAKVDFDARNEQSNVCNCGSNALSVNQNPANWSANLGSINKPVNICTDTDIFLLNSKMPTDPANSRYGWKNTYFAQCNDVDYGEFSPANNFTVIGSSQVPFQGTYDGRYKRLRYLKSNAVSGDIGLFSAIKNATLKRLFISDSQFTTSASSAQSGRRNVGGLVGSAVESTLTSNIIRGGIVAGLTGGGLVGSVSGKMTIANNETFIPSFVAIDPNDTSTLADATLNHLGGLVGEIQASGHSAKAISISDNLSISAITSDYSAVGVGGLIGKITAVGAGVDQAVYIANNASVTAITSGLGLYMGGSIGMISIPSSYRPVSGNFVQIDQTNSAGEVRGAMAIGGFAGLLSASVEVKNSRSFVNVSGSYGDSRLAGNFGGFVGQNYAAISDCSAIGNVDWWLNANSTALGVANTFSNLGGFVGLNRGPITRSVAFGKANGVNYTGGFVGKSHTSNDLRFGNSAVEATITNSASYGDVNILPNGTTQDYAGGFAGNNSERILYSAAYGNVTGSSSVKTGGFVGLQSAQIMFSLAGNSLVTVFPNASSNPIVGSPFRGAADLIIIKSAGMYSWMDGEVNHQYSGKVYKMDVLDRNITIPLDSYTYYMAAADLQNASFIPSLTVQSYWFNTDSAQNLGFVVPVGIKPNDLPVPAP